MKDKWFEARVTFLDEGNKQITLATVNTLSRALQNCACREPGHLRLDVVFVDASNVETKEEIKFTKEVFNPKTTYQIAYKGKVVEEITDKFAVVAQRLNELRRPLPDRQKNDYVIVGEEY